MYIKKWNDFKLNENVQQSLRILKDHGIMSNDIPYKLIKNLLSKNPSYMGLFTSFYYDENVSIDDLENLFTFLKSNLSNQLPKNPLQYDSYESLIDDIQVIKKDNAVKKVINELQREQKDLLPEDIKKDVYLYDLLYEISLIKNYGFFKKIGKIKTYDDLVNIIEDYVKKYKSGASVDSVLNIIDTNLKENQYKIVYNVEDSGYMVVRVDDYESLTLLGSTNWCIVNRMSSYLDHIDKKGNDVRHQYIVYNFNEDIGDPYYMIGVTVDKFDNMVNIHDYNDGNLNKNDKIYSILPEDIISLLVGPDDEYISNYIQRRDQIKNDKERLEKEANRRRIQEKIRENAVKKENGEWDDDEYVQSLRLFLIDENEIEEDEDIYDVIFELESNHYGGRMFEVPSGAEYAVYNDEEATDAAIDREVNLIDDIGIDGFFDKSIAMKYIDGERFADEYVDEDYYRDDWREYGISPSEDDEDEPDEDELEKFIQKEKDNIADDPYEYLKDMGYDDEKDPRDPNQKTITDILSNYMEYGWEEKVAQYIVDAAGRGNSISSYDGVENESMYNGTTYYIYRIN